MIVGRAWILYNQVICNVLFFKGKAFGIAFGCVLGMFPLLFLKERKDNDAECQSENG